MEDWTTRLVSWSELLLFHILPIAVAQLYDWAREWQILIAVILVLAFLHLWARTILRAARRAAREEAQSEARGLNAGLKLLRRHIDERLGAPVTAALAQPAVRSAVKPPSAPSAPPPLDSHAAIEQLRQAIRLSLGSIPVSDGPLSPDGVRLYKAAICALGNAQISPEEREGVFGQILDELATLEREFPPQSCRQAWQSLVKVNTLAREFHEPPRARAETLSGPQRATP